MILRFATADEAEDFTGNPDADHGKYHVLVNDNGDTDLLVEVGTPSTALFLRYRRRAVG